MEKRNHPIRLLAVFAVLCCVLFVGCLDDTISMNPSISIQFSQDTLLMDTVFTTKGSATRSVRILNTSAENIELSRVYLAEGADSRFRINVDGVSGNDQAQIRVPANDSVWVFVEVTIDPDEPLSVSPFVIEEELIVDVNGNTESMILQAFGQNANYITDEDFKGQVGLISCANGTFRWDDPKPYVVFGVVVIDSCTVEWPAGARIHIHGGVVRTDQGTRGDGFLVFGPQGRLLSEGTFDQPVVVEGDRLEPTFDDVPGQYGGIIFSSGSRDNLIRHTIVQNATNAIRIDSAAQATLSYAQIINASGSALTSIHADFTMDNSLIHSAGGTAVQAIYGGEHEIIHSTVASYGNVDGAISVSNQIIRDPIENIRDFNPLVARWSNSIFIGNSQDEVVLIDGTETDGDFTILAQHCIIKAERLLEEGPFINFLSEQCENCINAINTDTLFRDFNVNNFNLDSLSIADNAGIFLPEFNTDLNQNIREEGDTDIGCFQFFELE